MENHSVNTTTLKALVSILIMLAFAQLPLWADGPQTGVIEGRVLDAQGGALPGATVTLAGPQGEKTAITDDAGKYRFSLLLDGGYTVTAELEGLGKAEASTSLNVGDRRGINLTLAAGTAETITVTSEAPLVNKYETASTATLDAEVAEALSFSSRNYMDNIGLLPGAVVSDRLATQNGFSGGRTGDSLTFMEGVDVSQTRRGGEFRIKIPTTAVAQTTLQTAGLGAEYGRASNGQANTVIKTGTNNFHGEALYIAQNPSWREDWHTAPFSEIKKPDEIVNSFEVSLGGPIYRDRAWFFASKANTSENRYNSTQDGVVFDVSNYADPLLAKLNGQPGDSHQLSFTVIKAPNEDVADVGNPGDLFAFNDTRRDNDVVTLSWDYAVTPSIFLEFKAAEIEDTLRRGSLITREIDPNAPPDSPKRTGFRYHDLASGFKYNFNAHGNGNGFVSDPREQLNAAATIFRGNHELRVGADRHDLGATVTVIVGTEYAGRGYDENSPTGFATPVRKRVFEQATGEPEVTSDLSTFYVQDRIDIGDKWVVTAGLRLEDQELYDNLGVLVNDYSELAPRLTAVYDMRGAGELLLRGTAGRYYNLFLLQLPLGQFFQGATGRNIYDQFLYNPVSGAYDTFQRTVNTSVDREAGASLTPEFQDAFSVGVDWQLSNLWVAKARVEYRENKDVWTVSTQWDDAGEPIFDLRTWDSGGAQQIADRWGVPSPGRMFREHKGLVLELNRRMRDNWTVRANIAFNDTKGNVDNRTNRDVTFDGLGGLEVGTLVSDLTSRFRDGRVALASNRAIVFNLVGIKRWQIGNHSLNTGAYLSYREGQPWGLQANANMFNPESLETLRVRTLLESADTNQLPDPTVLNLNASWVFPIKGSFEGQLGVEVWNATNEDAQTNVNALNGNPRSAITSYVIPREYRVNVGIRF